VTIIAGRFQALDAARPGTPQRARDLETAQTVLLRDVPLPQDGGVALARAKSARGICHPSLVTLFDVCWTDERLLLAYEFLSAQTIGQMSGGQPIHPRRAVAFAIEIADALAELHAHGVAHGAISRSTVLVTMKGKAKLDRIGDPSVAGPAPATDAADLIALGDLLADLAGRPDSRGVVGAQAIEALVGRARAGKFESAATFAALLRRAADSQGQAL
jgi:serine/threonine protein kinase